ncbi:hypothetical protein [Dankookia sp. P2]|uniref:hypothetical protein n=1 Tax=Dankookia sp. P2 TaxID=3423955 RepID=UPI003D673DA8
MKERYTSISEMAAAERIERGTSASPLRLTLLAPNLIEAILEGRQSAAVGLAGLMDLTSAPWCEQLGRCSSPAEPA